MVGDESALLNHIAQRGTSLVMMMMMMDTSISASDRLKVIGVSVGVGGVGFV